MNSVNDTPDGVGCPIRTSTDQRLRAAPRGFSQRATSFIASWCQGIHRMPFSYAIAAVPGPRPGNRHARKPSSAPPPTRRRPFTGTAAHSRQAANEPAPRTPRIRSGHPAGGPSLTHTHIYVYIYAHMHRHPVGPYHAVGPARMDAHIRTYTHTHTSLNPRHRAMGRRSRERHARSDIGTDSGARPSPAAGTMRTRPETHQNLIHPDKEQGCR